MIDLREVKRDGFHFIPGLGVNYKDEPVVTGVLGPFIMGMCLSADGDVVPWWQFLRVSKSQDSVKVTVCHLRSRLYDVGAPPGLLETVPKKGLRWNWSALEGCHADPA